jgi:hypothetical protein
MLLNAEMLHVHGNVVWEQREVRLCEGRGLSGILPGYSCKEGGRVEDGLLLEFPCTPTRTRSV